VRRARYPGGCSPSNIIHALISYMFLKHSEGDI
jgi:hypothetical protein